MFSLSSIFDTHTDYIVSTKGAIIQLHLINYVITSKYE